MIWGITLIALSILAVPSLILSRKPNAKEVLAKIEPYQGWIGFIFCLWGLWGIITAVLNMGWLTSAPIWWVTLLAGSVVQAALGFMLGYGLIQRLILSGSTGAQEKAAQFRAKIAPKQGRLGVFGLIIGAWMVVASLLFAVT